jgi:hypothetical protein
MVGRVVTDPSLDLPNPCEMVPQVLILVNGKEERRKTKNQSKTNKKSSNSKTPP